MNILANAIDALEDYAANQGWQQTQLIDNLDDSAPAWMPKIAITVDLNDEKEVVITIADNGTGIRPAIRDKLFDPFFTTKPVGEGTGLGLAISRTIIVEQHQGRLECFSKPNQGTQFVVTLPLTRGIGAPTVGSSAVRSLPE
ncbi:MAG: HAMP domain-containing sensor histidine kinase [Phormidesmis sp.]